VQAVHPEPLAVEHSGTERGSAVCLEATEESTKYYITLPASDLRRPIMVPLLLQHFLTHDRQVAQLLQC
jgi:hypothetical protein